MPFRSNAPYIQGDKVFDLLGVSLVTSPGFGANVVDARVVLNLDPYRINEAGEIERPMVTVDADGEPMTFPDPAARRSLVFSDAYRQAQSDPALAAALMQIGAALQSFIDARGL